MGYLTRDERKIIGPNCVWSYPIRSGQMKA